MDNEQAKERQPGQNETGEMPRYVCHKEVWAVQIQGVRQAPANQEKVNESGDWYIDPIEEGYAPILISHDWFTKHRPQVGGYYVVYKDGYASYSPMHAFVEGYTRV